MRRRSTPQQVTAALTQDRTGFVRVSKDKRKLLLLDDASATVDSMLIRSDTLLEPSAELRFGEAHSVESPFF